MPSGNKLNPGIYCNGITIQSTSGTLTFTPGLYVLAGGGLTVSSNATIANATTGGDGNGGVIFYNTRTSTSQSWGCSATNFNAKPIKVQGGLNSVTLSAPTSGTYAGIVFFEDRNLTSGLSDQITGGSSLSVNGALYFKLDNLTYSGGSVGSGGYLEIVADTITISGTSNLSNDHSTLANVYTLAPHSTGGGLVQ